MKPTSKQKAAAWRWAAHEIEETCRLRAAFSPPLTAVQHHALEVIVPLLRQRARIIERNARARR